MGSCRPAGPWLNNEIMKTLIIARHGAFSHDDQQVADVNHSLSWKGRRQAAEMASQFAALQIKPDFLVSSHARRTIETAAAYAKKLGIPLESIQVEENIFEAERAEVLRLVQALDDKIDTVLLFGHHPGITLLLHHLVDSKVETISMGAFAVLELFAESWRTVSFKKGRLLEYVEPKGKGLHYGSWWFAF